MEGPTPVSALIHAATMVTAGVFLMARMVADHGIGTGGARLRHLHRRHDGAVRGDIGCVQTDIKKVIAYSTCSQLGYMFVAAGVGAFQVSIFHLMTHAFFKALLFLSAGSVIHAMSGEQDMRKMGGIWRKIPITYTVMWAGSLALGGVFPFAGYYSKDAILDAAFSTHTGIGMYGFVCGSLAAFLTAFYSWRVLILTFHGKPRADHHVMEHVHESPWLSMTGPLMRAGSLGAHLRRLAAACEPFIGDRQRKPTGQGSHLQRPRATTCWRAGRAHAVPDRRSCPPRTGVAWAWHVSYLVLHGHAAADLPVRLAADVSCDRIPLPAQ